ncbi:MAG TPA: DNA alkylation repair protein [Bacilli bacterium]|nr:DNA alkylation repair protein [Bacilli bacterium]
MDKYLIIKNIFTENKNPNNATMMAKYMRNQFAFLGITSPVRKQICKEFLALEKKNKKIDWELLDKCFADEHREFQYFVCDYLLLMKNNVVYEEIPKLKKYIVNKSWWDTIDILCKVIGNVGLRDNRVKALMIKYSQDSNFWVRRIAIEHQLCLKEKTNHDLLAKIIVNNFGSTEFFINKAIGWSLRDYSKTNPDWVREFINNNKKQMDKLSINEASKYL